MKETKHTIPKTYRGVLINIQVNIRVGNTTKNGRAGFLSSVQQNEQRHHDPNHQAEVNVDDNNSQEGGEPYEGVGARDGPHSPQVVYLQEHPF